MNSSGRTEIIGVAKEDLAVNEWPSASSQTESIRFASPALLAGRTLQGIITYRAYDSASRKLSRD